MKWIDGDELLFKLEQYRKFVEQIEDNYLALMVFNAVERDINKLKEDGITITSTDSQTKGEFAPVIHGRWIWVEDVPLEDGQTEYDKESFYQCSECKAYDLRLKDCHADYCWSCGAKMDLDEVDE